MLQNPDIRKPGYFSSGRRDHHFHVEPEPDELQPQALRGEQLQLVAQPACGGQQCRCVLSSLLLRQPQPGTQGQLAAG